MSNIMNQPDYIFKRNTPTTLLVSFRCNNFSNLSTSSNVSRSHHFEVKKIPIYIRESRKLFQTLDTPFYCSFRAEVSPTIYDGNVGDYKEPVVLELVLDKEIKAITEIFMDLFGTSESHQFSLKKSSDNKKLYRSAPHHLRFRSCFAHITVNILVDSECFKNTSEMTFDSLLLNGKYSDLNIIVEMKEKETGKIELKDKDPLVVKELLTYLYTGLCDLTANTHELFQLAHFLEIEDLQQKCESFLKDNINIKNIINTMILAENDQYQLHNLALATKDFISKNETILINDTDFMLYLLSSMNDKNISLALHLAEKYNLEKLWHSAILYLSKSKFDALEEEEFNNHLKSQSSTWFIEFLKKYRSCVLKNSKEILKN